MKDFLVEMADYNMKANEKMLSVIDPLPEVFYKKDVNVYYKSILGTIFHLAWAEIIWLKRYNTFFKNPAIEKSFIADDISDLDGKYSGDYNKCKDLLKQSDQIFIKFIESINENDLFKRVKYKSIKGEELEKPYWATIFTVLNHGTHHRGEISAILDMNKIGNDYSGFTLYVK